MSEDGHFIHQVYLLMMLLDIDPSGIVPNFIDADTGGRLVVAVPNSRVGIALEGDNPEPLIRDGWYVASFTQSALQQLAPVMSSMNTLAFEHARRSTEAARKSSSSQEETLLNALLRRGIPIPDRNHRLLKEDGKELTTPDFAWPSLQVAVFVDGLWWHHSREDRLILDGLRNEDNAAAVMTSNRSRAERDSRIRSEMQARGWVVLSCSDRDVETPAELERVVTMIQDTITRVREEKVAISQLRERTAQAEEDDGGITLDDLFS